MDDLVSELQERKAKLRTGGGPEASAKQHKSGKMTARERLDAFFDPGTFLEYDLFAKHIGTDYGLDKAELPADAVVTGVGKVEGRDVFAYSEDFTVVAGTFGERHGKKIAKTVDLAQRMGCPVVGMNDSGGARVSEQMGALSGYGELFFRQIRASGIVPQIALVMGPVAGGQAYSPGLMDFIFMVEKTSYMFIAGPPLVEAVVFQKTTNEELGSPEMHGKVSGVCDLVAEDDADCLRQARVLLGYLPANCREQPPRLQPTDNPHRHSAKLREIILTDPRKPYDMHDVIAEVVDNAEFFEIKEEYGANLIVGFARLDGYPVGIVANNPIVKAGCLDVDTSSKGARFIRFCDAFNIPLVSLQDNPGYLVGRQMERQGIIRQGGKMLFAVAEATVPKSSVVLRKAYAGGYLAMCSKELGADFVFSLPTAEIALMGAEGAVNVLFRKDLAAAENPEALRQERVKEFHERYVNPYYSAALQHVDDIIDPQDIRPTLIRALELCLQKQDELPRKKHGNMPV
jgi:acetyl-CoA carboxylase carboxyltransferase component